ncbi:MAG: stage II sporulation protein M [Planctomycetota bacterium]|nr:stage II sporulation protein M [Planctomycetaceae bacterium]MDQ3329634.1 stage II sporulation protein M [Planctomycetota bacterium]
MTKRQFLKRRRADWRRFEQVIAAANSVKPKRLNGKQVTEFSRLLRVVSHDLAVVRGHGWDLRLESYLNDLASRGYNSFYRAPPGTTNQIVRYFTSRFPRLMRQNFGYVLAGCALFFLPFFLSWGLVVARPELIHRVVPGEALEQIDQSFGEKSPLGEPESGIGWTPGYAEERTGMFGFYIAHNIGIAFKTFALGITFGVGTVVTLLYNGIAIGAIFGYAHSEGYGPRLFSFAVSHGSFELVAIGISGGAGLILANALVHPGSRTRWESLVVRGLDAVQVAVGAGAMLAVAALLEAYWSPAPIPAVFKYIVGGMLWLLVFAYIAFAGRGPDAEAVTEIGRTENGGAGELRRWNDDRRIGAT